MQDPWQHLRRLTTARIALGRAGGSLPTAEVLRFNLDHALARDAVWAELDVPTLRAELSTLNHPMIEVATKATDRATYLHRPDLGRLLDPASEAMLNEAASDVKPDVVLIVADGLSAVAAQRQAPAVLALVLPTLKRRGFSIGPIVIARQARVGLQDAIGQCVGARCAVSLIGERPGLGTADSLGAYLVFDPKPGNTDADRNCVSNIHAAGLKPTEAAAALDYLITQSLQRRISGVRLKDDRLLSGPPSTRLLPDSAM